MCQALWPFTAWESALAVGGCYVLTIWVAPFRLTPAHQVLKLDQLPLNEPQHTKTIQILEIPVLFSSCDQLHSDSPRGHIGLIQLNKEGWTRFSEGWKGCPERFPEVFNLYRARALPL